MGKSVIQWDKSLYNGSFFIVLGKKVLILYYNNYSLYYGRDAVII